MLVGLVAPVRWVVDRRHGAAWSRFLLPRATERMARGSGGGYSIELSVKASLVASSQGDRNKKRKLGGKKQTKRRAFKFEKENEKRRARCQARVIRVHSRTYSNNPLEYTVRISLRTNQTVRSAINRRLPTTPSYSSAFLHCGASHHHDSRRSRSRLQTRSAKNRSDHTRRATHDTTAQQPTQLPSSDTPRTCVSC